MKDFLEILYALAAVATVAEFVFVLVKDYKQQRKVVVEKEKTGNNRSM